MGIGSIAAIFGPPLAGWTFDTLGSYRLIWLGYIGLFMVAIVLVSSIRPLKT
jgi:cyanate permease